MSSETPSPDFKFAQRVDDLLFLPEPLELRLSLLALAGFLAICGIWMLLPALILHKDITLPLDRNSAVEAAAYRPFALVAAEIGGVRGDLWAQAAFTDAKLIWTAPATSADRAANAAQLDSAKSDAETALALGPINGAAWLFLAQLPNAGAARAVTLLQMSYFTAPNDLTLAPLRLESAITTGALLDKDIQELAKGDLRLILTNRPQDKIGLIAAHRVASPQIQSVFEALAAEVDSAFAQSLRAGPSK